MYTNHIFSRGNLHTSPLKMRILRHPRLARFSTSVRPPNGKRGSGGGGPASGDRRTGSAGASKTGKGACNMRMATTPIYYALGSSGDFCRPKATGLPKCPTYATVMQSEPRPVRGCPELPSFPTRTDAHAPAKMHPQSIGNARHMPAGLRYTKRHKKRFSVQLK